MSIVGPRALTKSDIERFAWGDAFHAKRWSIKPGITGLAQLYGGQHKKTSWFWDMKYLDKNNLLLDLVIIQVYITNAYRAYKIADRYREKGCYVILGGLHVTSLPEEASQHADTIFLGPGEEAFPQFLVDFKNHHPKKIYKAVIRTLDKLPPIRRDLIKRYEYLVPNSIVVTQGCPHHCHFCYVIKMLFSKEGNHFTPKESMML